MNHRDRWEEGEDAQNTYTNISQMMVVFVCLFVFFCEMLHVQDITQEQRFKQEITTECKSWADTCKKK